MNDIVHAEALKQVSSCELFIIEAIKINVLGTESLVTGAIDGGCTVYRMTVYR